jgi:hypothetical protein
MFPGNHTVHAQGTGPGVGGTQDLGSPRAAPDGPAVTIWCGDANTANRATITANNDGKARLV